METLFPGLQAMENVHPVFVHIPLVLLPLALGFHAVALWRRRDDWQRVAVWLLYLGTLGALAAAGTGLLAEESVEAPEASWETLALHETLMLISTGLAVLLSLGALVGRRRGARAVPAVLLIGLLVLTGILAVGADRGGQLVYQFGVSVQKPAPTPAPEH